jgi:hypothetical protein
MSLQSQNKAHSIAFDPMTGSLTSNLADVYRQLASIQNNERRVFSNKKEIVGASAWNIVEEFEMDMSKTATVAFNYKANSSLSGSGISLVLPNGTSISPTFESEKSGANFPSTHYGHVIWKLQNTDGGKYMIQLFSGSGDIEYFAEASGKGAISAHTRFHFRENLRVTGTEVSVIVTLADNGPITGANVIADITTGKTLSDAQTWSLHLFDDGAHGDGFPNDGVYGNIFTRTSSEGPYSVTAHANGLSKISGTFNREVSSAFYLRDNPDYPDFDADGLPNIWESRYGLDPRDASGDNGTDGDPDLDKIKNWDEFLLGTNPMNSDTDNGGESDFSEVINDRDPYYEGDDNLVPPFLHATPGDGNVSIYFDPLPSYHHLLLYRAVSSTDYIPIAKDYVFVTRVEASPNKYVDSGLTNGLTYFYKMVAVSALDEESGYSGFVSAKPNTDVTPPFGTLTINNGNPTTNTVDVNLSLYADSDTIEMRVSQDASFNGVGWIHFNRMLSFTLAGTGVQWIYAQFKDAHGNIGGFDYTDTALGAIIVDPGAIIPTPTTTTELGSTSSAIATTSWNMVFSLIPIFALGIKLVYRQQMRKKSKM